MRRVRARAHGKAHRPRRIRRARGKPFLLVVSGAGGSGKAGSGGIGKLLLRRRLLHDDHKLEVDLGNGILPFVQPAQELRAAALDRRGPQERIDELVPWVRPDLGAQVLELDVGNPVRELVRHVIGQRPVIDGKNARRRGNHLREPPALAQPGGELPHGKPLAGLVVQAHGHAPRAHKLGESLIRTHEPEQIRGEAFALLQAHARRAPCDGGELA